MLGRLFFVATLVAVSFATKKCPNGWISGLSGRKCYYSVPLFTTFSGAENACKRFGGHLASVHNNFDYDRLVGLVSVNANLFWLGGQRGSDDEWRWTDGSNFDFNNWAAGEPSRRGGCLVGDRASRLWGAVDCEKWAGFVCETDAIDPPFVCSSSSCEYKFYNHNMTWIEAEEFCANRSGHLVSVHDNHVHNLIANQTFTDGVHQTELWIGGWFNPARRNRFAWTDGSPNDFVSFAPGAVLHTASPNCVTRINGVKNGTLKHGWFTEDCNTRLPFVCEGPRFS